MKGPDGGIFRVTPPYARSKGRYDRAQSRDSRGRARWEPSKECHGERDLHRQDVAQHPDEKRDIP